MADTLIITGIVGIGLDFFATKVLIERVASDLAERLVGRGLPTELQAQIRQIVDTDLVRENLVKAYSLSDPSDGKITLDITVTFSVKNYSNSVVEFKPHIAEETFYKPYFYYLEYSMGKKVRKHTGDELAKHCETATDTNVKSCTAPSPFRLSPIQQNPTAICHVLWKYRITMPDEYSDVTSFGGATIGVTFRVDRKPDGYEFLAARSDDLVHAEGGDSWRYDRPFLINQHLRVWWFRKEA